MRASRRPLVASARPAATLLLLLLVSAATLLAAEGPHTAKPATSRAPAGPGSPRTAAHRSLNSHHQHQQQPKAPKSAPLGPNKPQNPKELQQASLEQAQLQARLMMGYNNTPPLFVTATRDFFVDVARYPPGTRIATIKALDMEGDPLEYSLQPASVRDASPYFAIDANSGELRLAHSRQFHFQPAASPEPELSPSGQASAEPSDQSQNDEPQVNRDTDASQQDDSEDEEALDGPEAQHELSNRNLYLLNVAANDGRYSSVVELQIHVINSSSITALGPSGLPVQLTTMGGRRAGERLESLMRRKTAEFYGRLSKPEAAQNSSTIVYPAFVNPGLVRPSAGSPVAEEPAAAPSSQTEAPAVAAAAAAPSTVATSGELAGATVGPESAGAHERSPLLDSRPAPEPVMVSLVIVCSCLVIALVLLMFVVPLSVKRLRRRLKHVEMQHERLSQHNSIGSSTCRSSSTASSMATHRHLPSLSQFTMSSDNPCATLSNQRSPVCRQLSLDSTLSAQDTSADPGGLPRSITGLLADHQLQQFQQQQHHQHNQHQHLHHFNHANPAYLGPDLQRQQHGFQAMFTDHHHHHQQARSNQQQPVQAQFFLQHSHLVRGPSTAADLNGAQSSDNIYCPLDDEAFYLAVANPEQPQHQPQHHHQMNLLHHNHNLQHDQNQRQQPHNKAHPLEPGPMAAGPPAAADAQLIIDSHFVRNAADSRPDSRGSESGSSLRSLQRFLSLPARHAAHAQQQQPPPVPDRQPRQQGFASGEPFAKTIARAGRPPQAKRPKERAWELDCRRLESMAIIDEGQFGLVWRAELLAQETGQPSRTVAVKTNKKSHNTLDHHNKSEPSNLASLSTSPKDELMAEAEVMKLVCEHPNVVKILYCATPPPPRKGTWLVMEYVELGKLQSYLRNARNTHRYATTGTSGASNNGAELSLVASSQHTSPEPQATSDDPYYRNHLTSRDLIKFIYHVAKGMEYIASKNIVHRDLASRNILINSDLVCKIGDFGMARHMQSPMAVYERHSRKSKVPVRWMAPEVLLNNRFTYQSDVFSFAILMWEIVTLGSTPYPHLETEQVINEVARAGARPDKPEYCHSELHQIMSQCWHHEPTERPIFAKLVVQFDQMLMSQNDYIELDQYADHDYYNIALNLAPLELL